MEEDFQTSNSIFKGRLLETVLYRVQGCYVVLVLFCSHLPLLVSSWRQHLHHCGSDSEWPPNNKLPNWLKSWFRSIHDNRHQHETHISITITTQAVTSCAALSWHLGWLHCEQMWPFFVFWDFTSLHKEGLNIGLQATLHTMWYWVQTVITGNKQYTFKFKMVHMGDK